MKKLVAGLARRAWDRGGWLWRTVAVLTVLIAALVLGGSRPAWQYWRRTSGAQCGMSRPDAPLRAASVVAAMGLAVEALPPFGADTQWQAGDVQIRHLAMAMPCDDALVLRVQVVPRLQGITVAQLQGHPIRTAFETAAATFVEADGGLWMMRILPLPRLQPSSLKFAVEELAALAEAWRAGWLDEAKAIASGAQQPPATMRFRPGRDPASVLRRTEEMLANYGIATAVTATAR